MGDRGPGDSSGRGDQLLVLVADGVGFDAEQRHVLVQACLDRREEGKGFEMAGRQTFFSFHYARDVWRATNVRKAGAVDASAAAGWNDASLWEATKRKGDSAIRQLINTGLAGTSVTAVLIGAQTSNRRWVEYEIQESINDGKGLLGVHIHTIKDQNQQTDTKGAAP